MSSLTFRLITPEGTLTEIECDSVHLCMNADSQGRGDGFVGIRPGHVKALISLKAGPVQCFLNGKQLYCIELPNGFATVDHDVVTVVTGALQPPPAEDGK